MTYDDSGSASFAICSRVRVSGRASRRVLSAITLGAGLAATAAVAGVFDLPKPAPPDRYGTVLIDRQASTGACEPVVFSHWRHRARFSCRVCHYELGFDLLTNSTEITEADNRHGLFCGACHDGTEAFSVTDKAQCKTCHAGKIKADKSAFKAFSKILFSSQPSPDFKLL